MDNLFNDLKDMDALIIDLRFNMGGSGDLVTEFTNRLISERQLAYTYQFRFGEGYNDFDAPVNEYIEPEGVGFRNKPVIVLTSNNTVSAGDAQAMLLKGLPNVTLMGETTFGIFSEAIPRTLPNGWMVALSTQKLLSATGECFEQKGIAPDIEISPVSDDLLNGRDNMLDQALNYIETELIN
jgi:C-terminal processing protease CtpA/Prc